jgi:hypothetical protein
MISATHQPGAAGAMGTPERQSAGAANQQLRKAQALQRLPGLKQGIVLASIAAFSAFSLLVGSHQIGTSSSTAVSVQQDGSSIGTQSGQYQQPGYFNQNQGGYGFGSGGSSQAPVAGSGTS